MDASDFSSKRSSLEPIDIEISSEFFSDNFLPLLHKAVMSNVKVGSKGVLNLIISLRISLMHELISLEEYNLLLTLIIALPEFWKWREAEHSFIDPEQKFDANEKAIVLMKKQFS